MARATWDGELERIIKAKWSLGEDFVLDEVYSFVPHFKRLYPANFHPQEKLRQTLQHLRDKCVVQFVNDFGTYRRIA